MGNYSHDNTTQKLHKLRNHVFVCRKDDRDDQDDEMHKGQIMKSQKTGFRQCDWSFFILLKNIMFRKTAMKKEKK